MNENDRNLYIESLESENENLRRELRSLKEDTKELNYEKFKAQKELQKTKSIGFSSVNKADMSVSINHFPTLSSFLAKNGEIILRISLEDNEHEKISNIINQFTYYCKENGLFNIDPKNVTIK